MTAYKELTTRSAAAILPTYGAQPLAFTRGQGTRLWDSEGRQYLDFLSGLAVTSLGHAHPAVTAAVTAQAATLTHVSNLFLTEPAVALAERLKDLLGWADGKAFFCNSGAEAVEAALKLARRHGKAQDPGKVGVVALEGAFHGRTLGSLAVTGNQAKREPFAPLGEWVTHVPIDDPAALTAAVNAQTCAVILEVVQGEAGVRVVDDAMFTAARKACDKHGALLIVDEVQTGVGRLGSWFAWQQTPVVPDVVTLAKALANGLPIGAVMAHGAANQALVPGDHASTFGGNPVMCAAALAVLETIEADDLVEHALDMGKELEARLDALIASSTLAVDRRGRGLLQALVLAEPLSADVTAAALERGLVVNNVAPDAIRFAPPLTVQSGEIDRMAALMGDALEAVAAKGATP